MPVSLPSSVRPAAPALSPAASPLSTGLTAGGLLAFCVGLWHALLGLFANPLLLCLGVGLAASGFSPRIGLRRVGWALLAGHMAFYGFAYRVPGLWIYAAALLLPALWPDRRGRAARRWAARADLLRAAEAEAGSLTLGAPPRGGAVSCVDAEACAVRDSAETVRGE